MAAASLSSLLSVFPQPKLSFSCSSSSPCHSLAFCSCSTFSFSYKALSISFNSFNSFNASFVQTNSTSMQSPIFHVSAELKVSREPLKVMISGAPASGKGTQCELIVKHHNLVHISAGDLLRAEVAAGTENGRKAKEYMTKGELVPDDIVVNMVKERLSQPDAQTKGWLLDGYPRSQSQADAIEAAGLRPDVFILLEVPDTVLVERVVGRRLDPITGKIYHLKYSPPETQEIADRLTQRIDDTDYQAKLRLQTHSQNVDAVVATYQNVIKKVDGNRPKEEVYQSVNDILMEFVDKSESESPSTAPGGS